MSIEYTSNHVISLYLSTYSGGSRGRAGGPSPRPLFWLKKRRKEEKQAGKQKKGPLLTSRSGSTIDLYH